MKKVILILLALLALTGCGKKGSLKVTDPAERAAMRTRDTSCPYDSVLTAKGLKITFNVISQIKPKKLAADYKEAKLASAETKPIAQMKDAYATVKKDQAEVYNPGLTIYCTVMFIAFVLIVLGRVIYALFHND